MKVVERFAVENDVAFVIVVAAEYETVLKFDLCPDGFNASDKDWPGCR